MLKNFVIINEIVVFTVLLRKIKGCSIMENNKFFGGENDFGASERIEEWTGQIKNSLSGFLRVCLVGLLVLLQIAVIILLPFILSGFTIYFYLVMEVASLIVTLSLVNDNRSPSYKVSWICICLLLPISGHIMYALWGKMDSKKKIERKILNIMRHGFEYLEKDPSVIEEYEVLHPTRSRMAKYMETEHFPLFKNNEVEYFPMGEDVFKALFQDLKAAKKFVLINFFIVAEGAIWDKVHQILLKKIKEGVEVKFMYDDFGAMIRTDKNFARKLRKEGFEVRIFNSIHRYTDKLYMNYRSHQKIVVIDGNIGYTGGFNLADEYANIVLRFGIWKDNGIRLRGDAVWGLTVVFLQMWEVCGEKIEIDFNLYRPTVKDISNQVFCQVISDGPANNPNNPIESIYRQMIQYAKEYLYITTPYLIIEHDMQDVLVAAVKSGIDVRIITPYIPDKKNVKLLTNYNYGFLLKNGIKIFEYLPGFIHAKTIISDTCGIVGTINMDYRSFYLHYENGVWISDSNVIAEIKNDLEKTFEESKEITYEEWCNRPLKMKMQQSVINLFSTLM